MSRLINVGPKAAPHGTGKNAGRPLPRTRSRAAAPPHKAKEGTLDAPEPDVGPVHSVPGTESLPTEKWRVVRAVATEGVRVYPWTTHRFHRELNPDGTVSRQGLVPMLTVALDCMTPKAPTPFMYSTFPVVEWTKGSEDLVEMSFPQQPTLWVPKNERYEFLSSQNSVVSVKLTVSFFADPKDNERFAAKLEMAHFVDCDLRLDGHSGPAVVPCGSPILVLASETAKGRRIAGPDTANLVFLFPGDPTPAFAPNTVYVWVKK